jgi:DNA-directed RNA polymerase specialized sigma24 family protein
MTSEQEETLNLFAGQTETAGLLRAIIVLMLDSRENSEDRSTSPVMLLHQAGLPYREIAQLTGRSPDAVRMAITRAKAASSKRASASTSKAMPGGS